MQLFAGAFLKAHSVQLPVVLEQHGSNVLVGARVVFQQRGGVFGVGHDSGTVLIGEVEGE